MHLEIHSLQPVGKSVLSGIKNIRAAITHRDKASALEAAGLYSCLLQRAM